MTLSDISIRKPVFAWMLMLALIVFGAIGFSRLGVSQLPDVDFPVVSVSARYEGASPEIIEVDVVDILEDAVMSVTGIKKVSSVSRNEQATLSVEFELDRDIDDAVQEVESKINQILPRLPQGMDPPTVTKSNPEDQPIMWISLSGEVPIRDLMAYARDVLKDRFQTVTGVSEIILGGYIEPTLRVWLDPVKLNQNELTVQDVIRAIQSEHVEIPAGRIETDEKEFTLRFMGEALSPEAFGNIRIQKRGEGGTIYTEIRIRDVGRVEKGLDEIRRISRTNLKPAIGLGIKKQRGANAVEVASAIRKRLSEVQKQGLPTGMTAQVNFDSTRFIEESTAELNFTLILSALLTAVVCLFFLGSLRSALNILMAIPTSIVGTFLALYFFGFTLNTFTLLGLILAIGIVVDDAIMVLENIIRHQEEGKGRVEAALIGAREITPAAVAATLAIVAIFIPVVFLKDITGKFLFQFGITMSVAVLLSLLEALTLTPMRASRFISIGAKENPFARKVTALFRRADAQYERVLEFCLHRRFLVMFLALAVFAFSLLPLPSIRKELVPAQDRSSFMIRAMTPLGSSIFFTSANIAQAERIILAQPETIRYYAAVGGFGGGEVNTAIFFVTLKDPGERPVDSKTGERRSQAQIMAALREELSQIPNLRVFLQDLSSAGFNPSRGFPIEFSVRGPDWEKLTGYSTEILEAMKKSPTFQDVDTNYRFGMPEIQILPLREEASKRGVSLESIGTAVNALIGGQKAGRFNENGRKNDIRVKIDPKSVDPKDPVRGLFVRNSRGELVALADVVQIKSRDTLQSITRENRERAISLYGNLTPDRSMDVAIQEILGTAAKILPEGYRVVMAGATQTYEESGGNANLVLLLGIVVAYMILASQYNSFIHPVTVLLALPFSLSGAWLALWLTGQSLNLFSIIGLILLMGIVKKNSILLVDFTNQKRREGLGVREALLSACPQRLRPVLMTSFATLAGALPPALAIGPGSETHVPMATVVIGGVFVSTVLTLFVVPCAYLIFSRFEKRAQ